jgi:signal transduction histidine kinase
MAEPPGAAARSPVLARRGRYRPLSLPVWSVGLRTIGPPVAVATGYYLGSLLGFALTLHPTPVSTLWPPNAILLAGLLLSPPASWSAILLATFVAHLAVQMQADVPPAMALCWFVSNCSEAIIGALLVRRFGGSPPAFDRFRYVVVFVLAGGLVAPLLSSFLDAAFVQLNRWGTDSYWTVWWIRSCSNVLATLTLVPFILTAAEASRRIRTIPRRAWIEATAGGGALLVTCWAIFVRADPSTSMSPGLIYAVLPFLIVAAVRLGPLGAATALLVCVLSATTGAVAGQGPFTARTPRQNALAVQLFMIITTVPIMLLAAVVRERVRAEEYARTTALEIERQRLELAHLGRIALVAELTVVLAHQLRQPLTAILLNAQRGLRLLADEPVPLEQLKEILTSVVFDDHRAADAIARLRDLSRKTEATRELLDGNDVVDEALRIARIDAVSRHVTIRTRLTFERLPVEANRVELQQVLLNLVVNACEAMDAVPVEERYLTVATAREPEGRVCIRVADTGSGIPPDQHERIFEPFVTSKPQGLGLGLSISRSIIEAHGGRLWAETSVEQGTTFVMALPLASISG